MDKASAPDIDTSVCCYVALAKENHVTCADVVARYRLTPIFQHGNGSWWRNACPRLKYMANQPTAVKAGVWSIAAIAIGGSDKADGVDGYVVCLPLQESR
jgi:hypothetical protein